MRSILGGHIGHAHPVGARGRGLRRGHALGRREQPRDDQHQKTRSHHVFPNVPRQSTHWLGREESRYSGVTAVTSVSSIISGKARAATPINVCTGNGAVPKFLARHWPYGTRFFMSVRYDTTLTTWFMSAP